MNHDWTGELARIASIALLVRATVFQIESFGQLEIKLDRSTLPFPLQSIGELKVELQGYFSY